MAEFEIGVVYQKDTRYFIAVDDRTLVTCKNGSLMSVRPHTDYHLVRSISVEDLCVHWGVDLDTFDRLMEGQLAPPQTEIKTRPRGSRRKRSDDDEYWRRHRTGRIARPTL